MLLCGIFSPSLIDSFLLFFSTPGPAEVPMMSPNGSIPPIHVPPGYVSQVTSWNLFGPRVWVAKPLLHNEDVISPPRANNTSLSQKHALKVRVLCETTKQTNVDTPNVKFLRRFVWNGVGREKVTDCDISAERSKNSCGEGGKKRFKLWV